MSEYSFLSKEEVETSEILKQRRKGGETTDFFAILGGRAINYYTKEKDKKYGTYWTRTDYDSSTIYLVDPSGSTLTTVIDDRSCGIRPVIPISYVNDNYPDIEVNEDGIIEFGKYPQSVASVEIQEELEKAFNEGKLEKTGNTYTTDSQPIYGEVLITRKVDTSFKPQVHEEIEYKGKKYIRAKVNDGGIFSITMSNGKAYKEGDYVWVEVEPVKWLKDEELGVFISQKILVAGIEYEEKDKWKKELENDLDIADILRAKINYMFRTYGVDFETSNIKHFMDEYLSRDIEQSLIRTKLKESVQKQDESYQVSDAERFANEGITAYGKIGEMYQEHLTNEKEIKENENEK